jgi:hypothetical protein
MVITLWDPFPLRTVEPFAWQATARGCVYPELEVKATTDDAMIIFRGAL